MKTNILRVSLLALIISFASCSKDDSSTSTTTETPTAMTDTQAETDLKTDLEVDSFVADFEAVAKTAAKSSVTIPTIPPGPEICGQKPAGELSAAGVTYNYDFGTGCTSGGKTLKGKLSVNMSLDKVVSFTFTNYFHNNVGVNGVMKFTKSVTGTLVSIKSEQINLEITLPGITGKFIRNSSITRTQIKGIDTPDNKLDDEFQTSGNWTTVFPDGKKNVVTIKEVLLFSLECKRHIKGIIEFNLRGNVGSINFGDGTCAGMWTLTFNGKSKDIARLGEPQQTQQ